MTIDIELLLAWHPLLFLWWESCVECLGCGGILTAIGGGTGDIHPFFAVKRTGNKFTDKKCCWEVTVHYKTYILLFTAHEPTADIVTRLAEVNVDIIAHLASYLKGMLNQHFAELLPLILRCNAKRSEGEYLLALTILIFKPSPRVHNVADNLAVKFKHKCIKSVGKAALQPGRV